MWEKNAYQPQFRHLQPNCNFICKFYEKTSPKSLHFYDNKWKAEVFTFVCFVLSLNGLW